MAITYLNRLVVIGTPKRVQDFRTTMRRTLHRRLGKESWQEPVPFSLTALARVTRMRNPEEYAEEPYSASTWRIRQLTPRRAEVRYQFQTRNLEMLQPLKRLSRRLPELTFRLMVHCLDDSSPESFQIRNGEAKKRCFSDTAREKYWQAAGKKFHLSGDEIYDDDDVELLAEERMRQDILNVWARAGSVPRRQDWWNAPATRMLLDEMAMSLDVVDETLEKEAAARDVRLKRARRMTRR